LVGHASGGGRPGALKAASRHEVAFCRRFEEEAATLLVEEATAAVLIKEARGRSCVDRERVGGEMEVGAIDPCWLSPGAGRGGWIFRARSALPTCEARFQLHNRAGLRGRFHARWAVLRAQNRATKQLKFG
jgi:hypothetical protein